MFVLQVGFFKVWTMCNHSIHTLRFFKRVHLLFLCHRFFKTKLRHVSSHMLRHMSPFVLFFPPLKRIVHWFQCELLSTTTSGNLRAIFIDFYRKSRDLWYVTRFLRFFWQFVNLQRNPGTVKCIISFASLFFLTQAAWEVQYNSYMLRWALL